MTTRAKRIVYFLLIIILLVSGIWYLKRPQPIAVVVKAVDRGDVEETVANTRAGTVKACRRARLSPATGGQISVLQVTEGEQVKAGQLLLEIWNKDLLAEIELSRAKAKAAVAKAKATCLQSEVSQRKANRQVKVQKSGAASEEVVDQAVTQAKAARADCESADANAVVAAAQVEVGEANLERTRLLAPFDGVVAEVHGELNEYVTPSPPGIPTPPVVDLINNACFYVTAPIDEVDTPRIQVGQPARISLDAFGDKRFQGQVRRVADYVLDREKQARTVEVEVEFSKPEDIRQLLAGYSADVEIIQQVQKDALRVPSNAVIDQNKVWVFLADEGILEQREIKIGMSNWDHTEVKSGIAEGEWVVSSVDRDGIEEGALAERDEEE